MINGREILFIILFAPVLYLVTCFLIHIFGFQSDFLLSVTSYASAAAEASGLNLRVYHNFPLEGSQDFLRGSQIYLGAIPAFSVLQILIGALFVVKRSEINDKNRIFNLVLLFIISILFVLFLHYLLFNGSVFLDTAKIRPRSYVQAIYVVWLSGLLLISLSFIPGAIMGGIIFMIGKILKISRRGL